ncbi:MAG: ABC transporter ATP-binding protein/permease [Planctomycetes bacterium]|nr:ABC transporter ATP-binding protein/permease [Planctomycetota bacterium]
MTQTVQFKPIKTLAHVQMEGETHEAPLRLSLFRRIFSYSGPYRAAMTWLIVSVVLRGLQGPAMVWALSAVVNGPITRGSMNGLWLGVAGYTALMLFTEFTFYHRQHLSLILGEGVVHDLRDDIFRRLQAQTMSYFHRTKIGRIISRVASDAEAVRMGIQNAVFVTAVNFVQMVGAAAIMAWTDRTLFLVVVVMAPLYVGTYHLFKARLSHAHRAVQESFSRVTANIAESIVGIRVTQGFVRQDLNAEMFGNLIADHADYNVAVARASGAFAPILEMLNQVVTSVIFIVGGYLAIHSGHGNVGTLITFYFLTSTMLQPLASIGNQYTVALTAMAGAERVFRMLDTPPDFVDAPDAQDPPPITGRVEFRGLGFEYRPGTPVLIDVNFTAEPGQTVALVGHTGSGKSTIINLLSKFYPPTRGALLIDGHDILKLRGRSLRKQMGIVLQNNFLFTGTVMENLRVGNAEATDEQVIDAARQLDVLDLINDLPEGFQTVVGERGAGLSLGQRQLICFTRALVANPHIMILDEATSAVDTVTEVRVQKALSILLKGRTSFVVAHRLSTIRHADVVLVLDHGRIVERGTHDQLLATGGVYANLYQQFANAGGSR